MKPAWDKLMKGWNKGDRLKTSLIADVDCTGEGKPLCEQVGVEGFPTIKWGDVNNLEKYEGKREYNDLKKFAKENLKPMCSPVNIDLCNEEKKAEIAKIQALPAEELTASIEEKKAQIKEAEEYFTAEVKKLQDTYTKLEEEKKEKIAAIKESGLGLMQAVAATAAKKAPKADDHDEF
jgi:hypothetical protein